MIDSVQVVAVCGRTTMSHTLEIVPWHKDEDEQRRIHQIMSSARNQDEGIETIAMPQNQSPENPSPVDIVLKYQMPYH